MERWKACKAIEEAGGLLPANWLWWDSPQPWEGPEDVALVLTPNCGSPQQLWPGLRHRPVRLLTGALTPRQRCREYQGEPVPESDWLLLVGQAAGENRWEARPLYGLRVLLTRERSQAQPLAHQLEELGAEVALCPVLQFLPPDDPGPLQRALTELADYDWVLFTSPNGVERFFTALTERGWDGRKLSRAGLGCIGPGTRKALREHGLEADLVASESVAEGFLKALESTPMEGRRVLLPRAQEAREVLPEGLRRRGARVDVVACYKTVSPEPNFVPEELDWVILMSSSAARNFRQLCPDDVPCLCIGPVTGATAREVGFGRVVEAKRFDQQGVVEALLQAGRPSQKGERP